MNSENNYNMAVALLRFKVAYHDLVEASKALPDYDISEAYPFYLIDFESVENAVLQWCSIHAAALMKEMPNRVDNPACATCSQFRAGLGPDGQCLGRTKVNCTNFPFVLFSRNIAVPFLAPIECRDKPDEMLHLLYIKSMNEAYAALKSKEKVE